MKGVLLSLNELHRDHGPVERGQVVAVLDRVRVTFETVDGVSVLRHTVAQRWEGRTQGGKRFTRWSTKSARTIKARPGHPWLVTSTGPSNRWFTAHHFSDSRDYSRGSVHAFGPFVERLPEPVSVGDYYPLLGRYVPNGPERHLYLPAVVRRRFVGADNGIDLTRNLFGKTRYRRDLVKAVATASVHDLTHAWDLRGLVPVDWLVEILRRGSATGSVALVRPHLRHLDTQSLRNLTRTAPGAVLLNDLTRFPPVPEGRVGRVRNWEDLHDRVVNHALLFRPERNGRVKKRRPVTLPAPVAGLCGWTPGGHRVEIARHEDTLWEWATQMRHCIGGYGNAMRNGSSVLGGVFNGDGALVGNFELLTVLRDGPSSLRLSQLLGKANQVLPEAVRGDVTAYLSGRGVKVPDDYWGAGPLPGGVG